MVRREALKGITCAGGFGLAEWLLRSLLHVNAPTDLLGSALVLVDFMWGTLARGSQADLAPATAMQQPAGSSSSSGSNSSSSSSNSNSSSGSGSSGSSSSGPCMHSPPATAVMTQDDYSDDSCNRSIQMTAIKLARLLARKMELRGGAASVTMTPPPAADADADAQLLSCARLTGGGMMV